MPDVVLPRLHCYRCTYEWIPRKTRVPACPRCRSRLYAVPKICPVKLGKGLGIEEIITPRRDEIRRLARKFGVRRLRVFGSVRRREARPDSDVDLLVEWKREHPPVAFLDLPLALEDLLGRKADVVTLEALHWSIRPKVEAEAVPL